MNLSPIRAATLNIPWFWLGTWSLAGHGFGAHNLDESKSTLGAAIDLGVQFFDTAGFYAKGGAEVLLGEALSTKRQDFFISTKGGLEWVGNQVLHNARPEALEKACFESLARLQTDYIDLYQLHWPDPQVPISESIASLKDLKSRGLIRYWGVGNLTEDEITASLDPGGEIPHQVHFNPIHANLGPLMAGEAEKRCLNAIYSPLEQGLLSGSGLGAYNGLGKKDVRNRNPYFNSADILPFLKDIDAFSADLPFSLPTFVLLWILSFPQVSYVISGARTPRQLQASLAHARWISEGSLPKYQKRARLLLEEWVGKEVLDKMDSRLGQF
ncbi:MAG: aryl-alcohol dehydrogenase-like predicted oxidoreductase [Candidatus Marinamargulisbacteria bacterium]|jgi:aryl-alcohol dehydrogenase-like predicted oxidoreductase